MKTNDTIEKFAREHNVDTASVASLLDFFQRAASRSDDIKQALLSDNKQVQEAAVTAGVKRWHEQSQAFYQELLDNETPRAKQYRDEIYTSLKQQADAR